MSMLNTLVVVAVLVTVLVKRFIGEPINARDLLVAPVVLIGLGGYGLVEAEALRPVDLFWVAGIVAAGVLFGIARGATVRLLVRDGVLHQRYTGWTLAVWAATAAVSVGLAALAANIGIPEQARQITLSLGASLLGELIAIGPRALRHRIPQTVRLSSAVRAHVPQ